MSTHLYSFLLRFSTWIRDERVDKGSQPCGKQTMTITAGTRFRMQRRGEDVNVPEIVANWDRLMKRHLGREHINMHMRASTKGTKLPDSLSPSLSPVSLSSLYRVFYTFIANDRAREN